MAAWIARTAGIDQPQPLPVVPANLTTAPAVHLCGTCRLPTPPEETECAFCAHARLATANSSSSLMAHWAAFLAMMLVIFGVGWFMSL